MAEINPKQSLKMKNTTIKQRFWSTWKTVMLEPTQFFERLSKKTSYREPSMFFLKTQALLLLICLIFFGTLLFAAVTADPITFGALIGGIAGAALFIGLVMLYPILLLFSWGFLFVSAGLIHLFVILFGGEQEYKETFNVMAYSSAPALFAFIPFVGFAAALYSIVLEVIGIQHRQKLTLGKSVAVVVIPLLILLFPIVVMMAYILARGSP